MAGDVDIQAWLIPRVAKSHRKYKAASVKLLPGTCMGSGSVKASDCFRHNERNYSAQATMEKSARRQGCRDGGTSQACLRLPVGPTKMGSPSAFHCTQTFLGKTLVSLHDRKAVVNAGGATILSQEVVTSELGKRLVGALAPSCMEHSRPKETSCQISTDHDHYI